VTIVLDGWEVAVTRFEKKVGPFTIDIWPNGQEAQTFRWTIETGIVAGFDAHWAVRSAVAAGGVCPTLDEAKAVAERVAGLLGGLL
jgi:hypothetical protein